MRICTEVPWKRIESALMKRPAPTLRVYFSDYFNIAPAALRGYGAFNVSLVNDLPLFIDPFLLFNSSNPEYQKLHQDIIEYVRFLRDKAADEDLSQGQLKAWFMFREVKQTWLGFSRLGNNGSGLGMKFARALNRNLHTFFSNFGSESVAKASHLEKLCLIDDGIGRDNISDFTTNLIKDYLLRYTERFAKLHLHADQRRLLTIRKAVFNYTTETWQSDHYEIPFIDGDHVILTPRDLLTRDENWINKDDLVGEFDDIVAAVPDDQLRAQLNSYFASHLPRKTGKRGREKAPTVKERKKAIGAVFRAFPTLLDYYIRYKEDNGDRAESISQARVSESEEIYIDRVMGVVHRLDDETEFYDIFGSTLEETRARVAFLKDVLENKDGYRLFYDKRGKPMRREQDVQILFRLTWFATRADVNREVNNGRGPVDFKISRGAADKSLVEFKLASNGKLEMNLRKQVEIYQRASDAPHAMKVILYFTDAERKRVQAILKKLKIENHRDVVLIDARSDNKPSASNARD